MSTGPKASVIRLVLVISLCGVVQSWSLSQTWEGNNFFNNFWFWDESVNGPDPSHGYVYYANEQQALDWGYVSVNSNNSVYIGCDCWSVSSGSGRGSVRITSYGTWDYGLFIADLEHMPQGCGTWPAWWLVGPSWPNGGEIDIIEGVNTQTQDQSTLHTSAGCTMPAGNNSCTGYQISTDCNAYDNGNSGCGVISPSSTSYGSGFNANNGGVYACQWVNSAISIWYFPRNSIPQDIIDNQANPANWGLPFANFPLGGNCDASHFSKLSMVIDLTFCGDWAGSAFASQCGQYGSDCDAYVQDNPTAFCDAYWLFNKIQIYQ
jgi:hypothetical protein